MNKTIYAISILFFLTACATGKNDSGLVTLLSTEKNTNIYINEELVGVQYTQTKLPYRNIRNTVIEGRKKGCKTTTVKPDYEFDSPMLLNPTNILYVPEKYFSWDWWKPNPDKTLYNVTPVCD